MHTEDDRSPEQSSDPEDATGRGPGRRRLNEIIEFAAIVLFLAAATLFAIFTPPGAAPDEAGHAVYARAVSHGVMPTPAPVTETTLRGGRAVYNSAQAHHPPLWYAIVGGIHALTGHHDGLLTPIGRILNILTGLAALLLVRAAMHRAFPRRPLAIAAGLMIAVASPTFTFVMGSFNNDPLAVLAVCASIYLAVRALQSPRPMRWLLALGVVLGAGLLAKLTAAVIAAPLLAAGIGVARRRKPGAWKRAAWGTAAAIGIAAAMIAPWLVRNYLMVGAATFNCAPRSGLFGSMAEVIWQPAATLLASGLGLEEIIAGLWWPDWLLREHHTLIADIFVGGGVGPDTRPAWLLLLPLAIGAVGLAGVARQMREMDHLEPGLTQRHVLWMMIAIPVIAMLGILHQSFLVDGHILRWAGRYVPVMIPSIGMVIALGMSELLSQRGRGALPMLVTVAAVGLNSWAVFRVMRLYEHWTPGP
ncbi:MAG: glycosyltransferase family 39 protein [Armatimonadota bacterium]